MANSPQARKRARQNTRRRARNMSQRSSLRTTIKRFLKSIEEKNIEAAQGAYRESVSAIDKAASKGLHHANRAARLKKRLNNRLRALAA
ncbi:MAG: 30S ribosomal protein S20 [Pseudomonadota bacterium]